MIKSKYIYDILDLLLDGDEEGISAREQLSLITENDFEYTGIGVFVNFSHDSEIENYKLPSESLILNGVLIETTEFPLEAEATLFFTDGKINYLEIWCHYGEYPKQDLKKYTLTQKWKNSPAKRISN